MQYRKLLHVIKNKARPCRESAFLSDTVTERDSKARDTHQPFEASRYRYRCEVHDLDGDRKRATSPRTRAHRLSAAILPWGGHCAASAPRRGRKTLKRESSRLISHILAVFPSVSKQDVKSHPAFPSSIRRTTAVKKGTKKESFFEPPKGYYTTCTRHYPLQHLCAK